MELWKMQQNLTTLGAELRSLNNDIVEKTANPAIKIEEIRSLKQNKTEIEERFNLLKAEIDKIEEEQRAKLQKQNPLGVGETDEQRMKNAKAEFIRASLLGVEISNETRNLLGAIGDSAQKTGGEKILPVNIATDLIHEPFTKNPLRNISTFTNEKGLVLPKIAYELDDDDFITDEQTAKEIKLEGDQVEFGRHKFKVKARISDTVLHGSDTNLVPFVENALNSGLAAKEKKVAFTTSPKSGEDELSFYKAGIKEIEGTNKYKAIKAALADLHEDFRENAKIIMRYADYLDIIETLANGSATLYEAPPEKVLGKPTEFCDSAIDPIVGNFQYSHFNYDGEMVYDSDKDVDKGEYLFVLTGWFDHKIKLKSAFRIAKVKGGSSPS
ncbi:phage major capsid protein [Clostridiaceae bacterium 14S0207]|nr:phage major capsid protein [Clostridiaceae bacterium 14S0207]